MGVEVRSHKGPEKELLDFPIEKVEISRLIPHEQTIPRELDWFINDASDSKELVWPLLIGERNYTILDGHHRAAGLKQLSYRYVPAILIDYYDDELIQLDTWYPNIEIPVDEVVAQLGKTDLEINEVDPSVYSREELNKREITAFIGTKEKLYAIKGYRETIFKVLRDYWIDQITYYDDADMCMDKTSEDHTAVISWSYTKSEILEQVKSGIVHLPKTTRHTLKYQVPKCFYPLEDLK